MMVMMILLLLLGLLLIINFVRRNKIIVTPLVIRLVIGDGGGGGGRCWHQINPADPDRHFPPWSFLRTLSTILPPPGSKDRDESRQRSYRMGPLDGTGNILTHGCSSGRLASHLAAVMRLHGSTIPTIWHREKIFFPSPFFFSSSSTTFDTPFSYSSFPFLVHSCGLSRWKSL